MRGAQPPSPSRTPFPARLGHKRQIQRLSSPLAPSSPGEFSEAEEINPGYSLEGLMLKLKL